MTAEHTETTKALIHPLVDILESETEYLLIADLPGASKDSLEIEVEDGKLRLEAATATLDYRRTYSLAEDTEVEAITAQLEHGELRIRLPKRAAQVRKILING